MDAPVTRPVPPLPLPSRNEFDEDAYLALHPDVAAAVAAGICDSGWQHYTLHGCAEDRTWKSKPDPLIGVRREISPRDEMLLGNEAHYFDVGESALHCIEAALGAARRAKSSIRTILDLPCGHGRVLRFLHQAFPAARLTACDLNRDGVDFCAETFGATPVLSCAEVEAIPLHGEFDLIWCGSLLTHLDETKCAAFLRLFQRLLGNGGLLIFTLHGRYSENKLAAGNNQSGLSEQQIATLLGDYRRRGFGYVDYTPRSGYGFSLAHPAFVMTHFVPYTDWQLIGYHETGWDKRQDVICLRKAFRPGLAKMS